jgi:transposase, IS5 family
MLVDRYPPEDVFARVPELAEQTDPVLVQLDGLLDDEQLYAQVYRDLARRYRLTPVHGRPSTPAEVLLRLLVVQHLYAWSSAETVERVADALVLRWFCRVSFRRVPTKTTLLRWAATIRPATIRPATLHALVERATRLAKHAHVTPGRKLRIDSTCVQTTIHHPTARGVLVGACWATACGCSVGCCAKRSRWRDWRWRPCGMPFAREGAAAAGGCSRSIVSAASKESTLTSGSGDSISVCSR